MMFRVFVIILGLILPGILGILSYSCSEDESDSGFPDFTHCNCPYEYAPVCGEDGRNYMNSCLALCLKKKIAKKENCGPENFRLSDTMTWPISLVCIPVQRETDAVEVSQFSDGSVLYRNQDGTYFRGSQNLCRCLAEGARIAVPEGYAAIESLQAGDYVLTRNSKGQEYYSPILQIRSVPVEPGHVICKITLEDGKTVQASPLHPDAEGRKIGELKLQDLMDGVRIVKKELLDYSGTKTWDLLPDGETGFYKVNGVWLSSTIRKRSI